MQPTLLVLQGPGQFHRMIAPTLSRTSQRSKVSMSWEGELPPCSETGSCFTRVCVSATHWLHTPSYSWLVICTE